MEKFEFAGFTWPRNIYMLPRPNTITGLREKREGRKYCGPYYHAPTPNQTKSDGGFFYLDSDFQPSPRWTWADEVEGARIKHTGWYTDEHGISETIRGIVLHLPHGRHLAGWSMGEGMASGYDRWIYDDAVDAARAADELARHVAEREREYQDAERERMEREEAEEAERQERERVNLGGPEEEETY